MAEYIERGAVLEKMQKWHTEERLRDCVKDFPAADVVPVVRCKDCKHLYEDTFDGSLWCCRDEEREVVENHFCSYGERRDSDGNL